jgi:hypothetical protein
MRAHRALAILAATLIALLVLAPAAGADTVISEAGSAAGQSVKPQGLAVDQSEGEAASGNLYLVDQGNERVDVFDSSGAFVRAFGWGVDTGANALQTCTTGSGCQSGITGSGAGQFSGPTTIAVDSESHDVYVADLGNLRIEKFTPKGEFLLSFGAPGSGEGELSGAGGIGVGVGPGGTVYVGDSHSEAGNQVSRLLKFDSAGTFLAKKAPLTTGRMVQLAVDSSGDFYTYTGGEDREDRGLRKFDASGSQIGGDILPINSVGAIAVDSADDLYVAEGGGSGSIGGHILERDAGGTPLRSFGYGSFHISGNLDGLAPFHSAAGDIYAAEEFGENRVLDVGFPPPSPIAIPEPCTASPLGNTAATLNAEVNPEGKAATVHFEYISDADFGANNNSFSGAHPATATAESASIGGDFELHNASVQVTGLAPETGYRCRVIASNADGSSGGPEGSFKTLPPLELLATWVSEVGLEAATVNATVNPLGIAATAHFEYVDDADFQESEFAHAIKVPEPPGTVDFGAGETPILGSAQVTNLQPGTLYHYRVEVKDKFVEVPGPTLAFRTPRTGAVAGLPDERAYELVSPGLKNNAEVGIPGIAGGFVDVFQFARIEAAAASGEALTFTSFTAFAEPESAPGTSQYLAKRSAGGWAPENISPHAFGANPFWPPYRGFTPDLALAAIVAKEPPLAEGALQGFENLYLRDSQTGVLRTLTTETPLLAAGETFCSGYAGASADSREAIFAANGAFAGAPKGAGFSLYESVAGEGTRLVSVLPSKAAAKPAALTGFGAGGSGCGDDQTNLRHAISQDGSRIFWTYAPSEGESRLLARLGGSETIQLDATAGGPGPAGGGHFWAASADGSKALFTDRNALTEDAAKGNSAGVGDLYSYDVGAKALKDLTPGPQAAEVQGVLGASEDGSYVYFLADGALAAGASAGQPNLYLYHEGEGVRFIATLSGEDSSDWSKIPLDQTARVSPDGRHLAFLSRQSEALSGYDNTIEAGAHCQPNNSEDILEGDPHCAEAYAYDAETEALACVSCNPSGARPLGPASLPTWSNPYEGPRYLSADGSRLFFESFDALTPADRNKKRDVYEAERPGTGSCSAQSPALSQESGYCLFLISSGNSEDNSYLIDASVDGADVFLATRSVLTSWDTNENYDVYDARIGGGFPEPPQPGSPCEGEACKSPTTTTSVFGALGSATFSGTGNLPPEVVKPAVTPKAKPFTRAQKLAKALKQCKKMKPRRKRATCDKRARKRYGKRK